MYVFNPNVSFKLLKKNYFLPESTRPVEKQMIDVKAELSFLLSSLIAFKLTLSFKHRIKSKIR